MPVIRTANVPITYDKTVIISVTNPEIPIEHIKVDVANTSKSHANGQLNIHN